MFAKAQKDEGGPEGPPLHMRFYGSTWYIAIIPASM